MNNERKSNNIFPWREKIVYFFQLVKFECDNLPTEELRQEPTGADIAGNIYWTQVQRLIDIISFMSTIPLFYFPFVFFLFLLFPAFSFSLSLFLPFFPLLLEGFTKGLEIRNFMHPCPSEHVGLTTVCTVREDAHKKSVFF